MPAHIRLAMVKDAPAICDVVRQSITVACAADHGNEPGVLARWLANKTPENARRWVTAKEGIALVAYKDGDVVGFALVLADELSLCYVAPQVLHQGVGKALLYEACDRAVAHGMQALRLDSTRTALDFYLRHGFVRTGPALPWAGLEAQPMRKQLVART